MSIIQKNKKKTIQKLVKSRLKNKEELMSAKRILAKKFGIGILKNADVLAEYRNMVKIGKIARNSAIEKILRKRSVRTLSGIASVAVLTKFYPCPGECVYCPTEKDVPQSYLSNEPAVMRAIRCGYDPYKQVQLRLQALEANGHEPTKIELIIIGGTWSVLPKKYKYWYVKECFRGANEYGKKNSKVPSLDKRSEAGKTTNFKQIQNLKQGILQEQKRNEKAKYKIIGLTIETRPDYVNEKELLEMRELGCTRVEIGVQAVDDKILKLNKRGHGVKEIVGATKLLKDYGFKVTYHIMPGLPGSTPAKDLRMFKQLFNDKRFQPDQIKFYPTVVTRGSLLYRWWKQGKYKPYSNRTLEKLIMNCKKIIPPYVRVIRLIRDIPGESIVAGNIVTNLRQIMADRGAKCQCIRCREAGESKFKAKDLKLKIINYKASGGEEYFISYESKNGKTLYGFCRLRLPSEKDYCPAFLQGAALVRELHVYGELVPVGGKKIVQHAGLGKKLMMETEKIAKEKGFEKIAVISGIGVRNYYRKLNYSLKDSYMIKKLKD